MKAAMTVMNSLIMILAYTERTKACGFDVFNPFAATRNETNVITKRKRLPYSSTSWSAFHLSSTDFPTMNKAFSVIKNRMIGKKDFLFLMFDFFYLYPSPADRSFLPAQAMEVSRPAKEWKY